MKKRRFKAAKIMAKKAKVGRSLIPGEAAVVSRR
jgi:hypothetical protein